MPPTRRTPGGGNCSDVAGARPRRTVETFWTSGEVCSRCPPWQGRLRALPRGRAGLGAEGLGPGDRSRRCRFRYPHPVVLTTIPRHRGRTRGRGADLCLGRDRGHVQRKRTWPPPICRGGLLLEPGGGVPNHGCPLHTPLAREHASLCPGYPELFGAAVVGRIARRRPSPGWLPVHVIAMAISYILLLTAFYVDNGPHLPLWRSLPPPAHWLLPSLVGVPILAWTLRRHPLLPRSRTQRRTVES